MGEVGPVTTLTPEIEELLDVIRQLMQFNRGGTLVADPGEWSAWKRGKDRLVRYGVWTKDQVR